MKINPALRKIGSQRKRRRPRTREEIERAEKVKLEQYKERAMRLRPYFKGMFDADAGFDARRPNTWTPQQKAKITKYFRVMAPHITGDFKVKRYRREDNLEAAIDASLQEEKLKGQTAAVFSAAPEDKIEVIVRDGKATVKQFGTGREKIQFNKAAFLADPNAEIDRVLDATDAKVFRVIVGGNMQNKTLMREQVKDEIFALVARYDTPELGPRERRFDEWLNGLMAYQGTNKRKTYSAVQRAVRQHKAEQADKRKAHLRALSKRAKAKGRR